MALIEGGGRQRELFGEPEEATPEMLRAALKPIKSFRTRSGLKFEIVEAS